MSEISKTLIFIANYQQNNVVQLISVHANKHLSKNNSKNVRKKFFIFLIKNCKQGIAIINF